LVVYVYIDDFYFAPSNQASSFEKGYGLLDARVTWRSQGDRWSVSLWGRNLTDEDYRTHMIVSNIAGSVDLWNLPRTYGATLTYNFR
jgi:iron complex outermembrane receptor protein